MTTSGSALPSSSPSVPDRWTSSTAARLLLALGRAYTRHTPIRKGKYRLAHALAPIAAARVRDATVTSVDGRRFAVDFSAGMYETLYFLGEYERAVTRVMALVVRPGDVCVDVGANFGWYATLLGRLCGPSGAVHAFEPQPAMFAALRRHVAFEGDPPHIHLEPRGLGDRIERRTLYVFPDEPTGHASLSAQEHDTFMAIDCPLTTFDAYAEERGLGAVDVVKVDIEGAELLFLRGATRLFAQAVPPILLMEMAVNTGRHFQQAPNDLLAYIAGRGNYKFFQIDERTTALELLDRFPDGHQGANVLCVPDGRDVSRAAVLMK